MWILEHFLYKTCLLQIEIVLVLSFPSICHWCPTTMLNRNGEGWHSCLKGKAVNLLPLNMMLAMGFFIAVLYHVEEVLFYFQCIEYSYKERWLIFVKWFFLSYLENYQLFSFIILTWYIALIYLHILNTPYIVRINPTWSYYSIILCIAGSILQVLVVDFCIYLRKGLC